MIIKKFLHLILSLSILILASCKKNSEEAYPKFSDSKTIATNYTQLSEDFQYMVDLIDQQMVSNPHQAIYHADRLIKSSHSAKYKEGEGLAYYQRSYIYSHYLQKYDSALMGYWEALKIYEDIGISQAISSCYLEMGNSYYKLQFFDKAKEYYELFINNAQLINNKSNEAEGYRNMALAHQNLKQDYVTAALYFTRSLGIQKELNNEKGIADAYHSLAGTYYMRNDFNQASIYYLKTLEYRIKTEDNRLADTYFDLGLVYHALNNTTKAKEYFYKTLELSESINYQKLSIRAHEWLGELAKISKNYPTAIKELTIAQQLAEQDKNTHLNLLIDITDTFSKLYEEMGDDGKAMDYVHKKEAWEATAAAEKSRITKLVENQRFDTVKWEDTVEKGKEEGISMWWYIVSAVVISFVAGVKGAKIYTGIQNALSIIPRKKKNKRNISTQLTELKEMVSMLVSKPAEDHSFIDKKLDVIMNQLTDLMSGDINQSSDKMRKEAEDIYTKIKQIDDLKKTNTSIPKLYLEDLCYLVKKAKWLQKLAEEKKD